ncbi:hypothetical protein GCM10022377_08990 [Zhihengliuella alba]|uniref:LPXTG cell wall anchor domain-containing protein n=1 Tax=Zhihengliuella alba TaxID=547018 RepID=A0ABP7D1N8_9MICC
MRYLLAILIMAVGLSLGAMGFVYGEADDSPGLQGLSALLAIAAVVLGVRILRRRRRRSEARM